MDCDNAPENGGYMCSHIAIRGGTEVSEHGIHWGSVREQREPLGLVKSEMMDAWPSQRWIQDTVT